ncbi:hypothetical protein [Phormidesmis priestleyi]
MRPISMRPISMRPIHAWLLGSLGALSIAAPTPGHAATIRQNFELTVNSVRLPSSNPPDPILSNLLLPSIGTKGFGSYTYDESQIKYVNDPVNYPVGYYLGSPGRIAFSDFSLNFFDRTYTQQIYNRTRIGEIFLFDRTPSGQYTPQNYSPFFDTSKDGTTLSIGGGSFTYYPASPFTTSTTVTGSASGTFRFTDAEPVPEPSFTIVPFFALGLGWLCQRKRTAQKSLGQLE